jgi:glyoxylase-like metal-dependent hydrolase (beta-lactamase superfamily II)
VIDTAGGHAQGGHSLNRELALTIAPFNVGEIRCLPLSDGEYPAPWEELFPGAPDDRLQRWFRDHPSADREEPSASNCLLVQTPTGTALLDTGYGALATEFGLPTAGRLQTALRQHGVSVDDVDLVVLSHAHPDHIGGTIDFGGEEPVPAFPRARYVMAEAEWRFWSSDEAPAGMVSVVRPRLDALERTDRIELTEGEMEVLPGLRLLPAPGHTPGHLALAITSGREGALYLGDALVHESQFAHPDLDAVVDTLPGVTGRTRRRLLEQAVREGRSVVAFHIRRIGSVAESGGAFTFEPQGERV